MIEINKFRQIRSRGSQRGAHVPQRANFIPEQVIREWVIDSEFFAFLQNENLTF